MVDYGSTLSSVRNGQSLLVSVNIKGRRTEDIPERINLQVRKSDLDQFESGEITREQLLQTFTEKRY